MTKILIIRFSALGDVAMTVPVIYALATQYPELDITFLSRPHLGALYEGMPANVHFLGVDLKGEYAGFGGLNRLAARLRREHFDRVADLHDVLRSQYLRLRLWLSGARVAHIQKGRRGKKQLVRRTHKLMLQQPTSFMRYADVLRRLGYPTTSTFTTIFPTLAPLPERMQEGGAYADTETPVCRIGIAPFAAHAGKVYPLDLMERVVALLSERPNTRLYLFGGGAGEEAVFADWAARYTHVTPMTRMGGMRRELEAMSHLDVMLSMDSGNMHLASLTGIPVVSIWGATHPYAGFMGWRQNERNTLQVNDLDCRPCSVYGNKPCLRGDMACLRRITPEAVVQKLDDVLQHTGETSEL
jgi:ADP-heptose:LPS heptosyltransferase